MTYQEYIQSPEWQAIAETAKLRAGYKCQVCNSSDRLDAHHRTYDRLGQELPGDITVLCHTCHELFSKQQHRIGWFLTPIAYNPPSFDVMLKIQLKEMAMA